MPQQENIPHEEAAPSQVIPEKQFPGLHLSITSVTVPFTTFSFSVFTTSVVDAVIKQKFSLIPFYPSKKLSCSLFWGLLLAAVQVSHSFSADGVTVSKASTLFS